MELYGRACWNFIRACYGYGLVMHCKTQKDERAMKKGANQEVPSAGLNRSNDALSLQVKHEC
jgi:hypothetical protein